MGCGDYLIILVLCGTLISDPCFITYVFCFFDARQEINNFFTCPVQQPFNRTGGSYELLKPKLDSLISGFGLTFQKRFVSFRNENIRKIDLNRLPPWSGNVKNLLP